MTHQVSKDGSSDEIDVEKMTMIQNEEAVAAEAEAEEGSNTKQIFSHVDNNKSRLQIAGYMLTFFLAMVGMELALEAASTEFGRSASSSLASAVTLFQFGFCFLLPLLVSRGHALDRFPSFRHLREFLPYIRLSLLVFGATAFATHSLQYVTYPTKVVFKSAKLIPTMIVATFLQTAKRYNWIHYLAALLLCLGAAGYAFDPSSSRGPNTTSLPGLLLLLTSIICDAFVPNIQQKLLDAGLTAHQLMVNVNAVGLTGIFLSMLITGQLYQIGMICWEFPRLVLYLVLIGLGLSTAVLAYTKLIQTSGSVVAVAVATLRKVATVILSYLFFPKPLTALHVLSGIAVLAGIVLSSVAKKK